DRLLEELHPSRQLEELRPSRQIDERLIAIPEAENMALKRRVAGVGSGVEQQQRSHGPVPRGLPPGLSNTPQGAWLWGMKTHLYFGTPCLLPDAIVAGKGARVGDGA